MAAQDGSGAELMVARVRNVRNKAIATTGFPEVDDLLATLEPKLQRKALRKGTRAGAKAVMQLAKSLVPIGEGVLQQALTVRTAKGTGRGRLRRGTFGHMVTHRDTGADDPFYARFPEFGTVHWEGDSYIRPALYNSKGQVLSEARRAMIAGVKEIAAKAKKGPR